MTPGRSPAERLLEALVEICGPHSAHPGGPGDIVAGQRARFVAAPGSTSGVVATLRLAAEHDLAVITRGGGTKLDWGVPPVAVDLLLDTRRLAGVWHHHPARSTAEVGTGTTVRALQAALALSGQRLALDPPSARATVGGVLALNESGPLRHRFGTPDEQVNEYSYVALDGSPGRYPGGAAPTDDGPSDASDDLEGGAPAGVLLSASVAVQPVPVARRWVTVPASTPLQVHNAVADTLNAELGESAIEADLPAPDPSGAGTRRPGEVAVLIEGGQDEVRERVDRLTSLLGGDATEHGTAPDWWGAYPFGAGDVALRLTVAIADLHSVVYALRDATGGAVPVRGSVGVGTVHAVLPGQSQPKRVEEILDAVRAVLLGRGGRCVVVSAPPSVSTVVDMAGRADLW